MPCVDKGAEETQLHHVGLCHPGHTNDHTGSWTVMAMLVACLDLAACMSEPFKSPRPVIRPSRGPGLVKHVQDSICIADVMQINKS